MGIPTSPSVDRSDQHPPPCLFFQGTDFLSLCPSFSSNFLRRRIVVVSGGRTTPSPPPGRGIDLLHGPFFTALIPTHIQNICDRGYVEVCGPCRGRPQWLQLLPSAGRKWLLIIHASHFSVLWTLGGEGRRCLISLGALRVEECFVHSLHSFHCCDRRVGAALPGDFFF